MKLLRLVAPGFIVVSMVCGLLSPVVHADPPADGNIHTLPNVQVGGNGDSCTLQDRSTNWDDTEWWKSNWNYQNNYNNARADTDAFIAEFNANRLAGAGWSVTQNPNANNGHRNMITIQTFSPTATFTVSGGRLITTSDVRSFDIFLNPGAGCRVQAWNSGGQNVSAYGHSIAGEYGYFFVASSNITYPTGYTGPYIPGSEPAPRKYVALGDSYSSGEGNPTFDAGTAVDSGSNKNLCHRSSQAYPHAVASNLYLDLTDFKACSGATTDTVINGAATDGSWGEGSQLDALSTDTDVVTISIGGNDVNFGGFMRACLEPSQSCDDSTAIYADTEDLIDNTLPTNLASLYDEIQSRIGSQTKVIVVGYPQLVTETGGSLSNCYLLSGAERTALVELGNLLNYRITASLGALNDARFAYVDAMASGSPFEGHDMCATDNYIREYNLSDPQEYTAHPDADGHNAYYQIIRDYIETL